MKIEPNRYDGRPIAGKIAAESLKYSGSEAIMACELGTNRDFEIYFDAGHGVVESSAIDAAKSLMLSIGELDNKVQESCAAECQRTGLHPRNFEGMLAYIRIFPNRAELHYFGTGVNTEWDENVSYDGVRWEHLGVKAPQA